GGGGVLKLRGPGGSLAYVARAVLLEAEKLMWRWVVVLAALSLAVCAVVFGAVFKALRGQLYLLLKYGLTRGVLARGVLAYGFLVGVAGSWAGLSAGLAASQIVFKVGGLLGVVQPLKPYLDPIWALSVVLGFALSSTVSSALALVTGFRGGWLGVDSG
ncbi:MAG: hypothetical protein ABWK01_06290, partial [Infirmifilum sp.]